MKIVTVSQMQKAEKDCAQFGISLDQLMQNAGLAVAEEMRRILDDLRKQNILVLVGPGNNGGDGLVAARHLHDWGAEVKIYLCGTRPENDSNLEIVRKRGIHLTEASQDNNLAQLNEWLLKSTTVLDSIFGTGASRPLSGIYARILGIAGEAKKNHPIPRLIALDLPSGLNADTGTVDPATPFADNTITLGFPKVGLFQLHGSERAGKITVVDIGIPSQLLDYVNIELLSDDWANSALPERPLVSHKGTFGKVLAFTGSINYLGAAFLSCTAAVRVGAGLTTLAVARSLLPILASKLTEVTYLPLPETEYGINSKEALPILRSYLPEADVFLMGSGLGRNQNVINIVETILLHPEINLPEIVLDADGLNILSKIKDWPEYFSKDAVFTPHAGELSRLVGRPVEEIQVNRFKIAQDSAVKWNKTVVLKGAYTVIAAPDGRLRVSPFANPGLASAGTGDVLAGAIAGMIAQGLTLFDAAACGVFLHGKAGEIVKSEMGDAGMLASDLLPVLPQAIRQLKQV